MQLSKSLYTRGLQCVKSLWIKKYNKDVLTLPDAATQAKFEIGNQVGGLACKLFPDGKEVPYEGTSFGEKISLTRWWIEDGVPNIYEATFNYEGILVMVDILHINNDDSVEIYEVKSSTEVKDVHLHDASIQYYVLNGLGYNVKKTNIVHINNKYIRGDELEIEKLFSIVDVSNDVKDLQVNIPFNLNYFKKFLDDKDSEPEIDIGIQCSNPYDCDAMAYCWKHIPEYSVFDIANLRIDKKFELYEQGIVNISDIKDISTFSEKQQVQIKSEITQKDIINSEAIKEFLDELSYPIYHLDFETFQQAIPEWKGVNPYMQIPFQYSLHIEEKDGSLQHKEFLAEAGKDPRYELAKRLIEDIPSNVTVLTYNMGFEKGVIKKLADTYSEFSSKLMAIYDNIQDLMIPFKNKDYYVPAMRGSHSLKYVLPALVPAMEHAYSELEGVQNGGEAMLTYTRLSEMEDKEEVTRLRKSLLEYCKLDTLAMVKILQKLKHDIEKDIINR
ncbi:DUF2779 domain-containing protein [Campylobacterota bacterium]